MAAAADCAACHTDPAHNGRGFAGGRPIQTPFGVVASSEHHAGPRHGHRQLDATRSSMPPCARAGDPTARACIPAMPYPVLPQDDARGRAGDPRLPQTRAAGAQRRAIATSLPFPFNIRAAMRLWDAMYFSDEPFKSDPARSAEWNRGAYLVQGPGHCAACHTPKGVLGGDHGDGAIQGYSLQGWFAPNITDDKALGLGDWSQADIVDTSRAATTALRRPPARWRRWWRTAARSCRTVICGPSPRI